MPTTAQEQHVNPPYPERAEVIAEARRRAAGPVNPTDVRPGGRYDQIVDRRGYDWCATVLDDNFHRVTLLTHFEAEILVVADERDINPPTAQFIIDARAAAASRREQHDEVRRFFQQRDREKWEAALATVAAGVQLQVYVNVKARPRRGFLEQLGHAVPTVDVYSGRSRVHRAGRALCESQTRANPLQLEDTPATAPATCDRCLAWIPKVRPHQ